MPRPVSPRAAVAEGACEVQVRLHETHRASAPLWEAAFRTGDRALLAECQSLATIMRAAMACARRIAGLAEPEPPAAARRAA